MLSRNKFAQLAAVAALTVLFGANASMTNANAQAGIQADQKNMQHSRKGDVRSSSTSARAQAQTEQNTKKSRKSDTQRSSSRKVSSDRSRHTTTTRTTTPRHATSTRTTNRTVVHRDRRVVVHSQASSSVGFVVLGPRVVYSSYGSGWCRALHNGRHWAPRIGWHRGRHVGAVRCG